MTWRDAIAFLDPPSAPGLRGRARARARHRTSGSGISRSGSRSPRSPGRGAAPQARARALREGFEGTLFVLDEPSAGLHAQDARAGRRGAARADGQRGERARRRARSRRHPSGDWVIDLGPGAGPHGGRVVAEGTPQQIAKTQTRTGVALAGARRPRPQRGAEVRVAASPSIRVEHAREHNLKNVSCTIPHGKLCVVTGPSGSGKSSLAFDVVFAEGQRRFMETLTPYARQFLPRSRGPDVDAVTGVPPCIALEQRTTRRGGTAPPWRPSPRSPITCASSMRRWAILHCPSARPSCARALPTSSIASVVAGESGKHTVYAPAVRARKGTYLDLFNEASRAGVRTARVDGRHRRHRPAAAPSQDARARHRPDRALRRARRRSTGPRSIAPSRGVRARSVSRRVRRARTEREDRSSRPRERAARVGRASPRSTRAGSRSTPSKGSAKPVRVRDARCVNSRVSRLFRGVFAFLGRRIRGFSHAT